MADESNIFSDIFFGGSSTAADTTYDNTTSGLTATNVKDAIDEVDAQVDTNTAAISGLGALAVLDTVGTAQIDNDAVDRDKIGAAAVSTTELAAGAIQEQHFSAGAVRTDDIYAAAITQAKMGNSSVNTAHLITNAVTQDKMADDSVGPNEIVAGSIGTAHIVGSAVTTAKIDDGAVTNINIAAGAVDTAELAAAAVTTAKIAGGAVAAGQLGLLAVTTAKIDTDAVTSDKIGTGAVDNTAMADDAIGIAELSATGTASSTKFLRGDNAWSDAITAASEVTLNATGQFTAPGQSGCRLYTSSQTIPSSTVTKIVFDTVAYNKGSDYNATTKLYTTPSAGRYLLDVGLLLDVAVTWTAGDRVIFVVQINGNDTYSLNDDEVWTSGGHFFRVGGSIVMDLSSGATIAVALYQDSGAGVIPIAGSRYTWQSIYRLA